HQARLNLGYQDSYRALFGEADGIPGLIVDRYGEYLVVQILSLGIDRRKEMFTRLLVAEFAPRGILERSDVSVRAKEGLPETVQVLYGTVPDTVVIDENGLKMAVDLRGGQKTGTFLDQRGNHAALKPYVFDKTVLDCFSHTGGFGLHAAFYGASDVECVDISASAVRQMEANARLNGLSNIHPIQADVFSLLRSRLGEGKQYDVVILDPPAFTKTADKLEKAYSGYKEINLQAMKLLRAGGYLVTCSCSQHMTPGLFLEMLGEAAADSGRLVQMAEFRIQGQDHPTLLGSEESLYLKCVILRVEDRC
ncbi:MAG TPA: class I SAM-dependent rRNA methyltransferase, partial [Candidatus Izemoplasmatales bacterium]|nr:class I SAM-dependent rRNA methyltransferase [Candidatus Izemoplasmatales bacterium]